MKNHILGGLALVLTAAWMPGAAEAISVTVDCTTDTIAAALDDAAMDIDPDIITVNGTCTENVEIKLDDVTIQGDPNDGVDTVVGELLVNGARRVSVLDLTVQNTTPGTNHIIATNGAAVRITNVIAEGIEGSENFADNGIVAFSGATAIADHVTIRNTGRGVAAEDNASVEVHNGSLIHNNATEGVLISRGSSGLVMNSTIQNNIGTGILFHLGGGGNVINSTIQNNGGGGIDINEGSSGHITNSTIQNNGEIGIHVGYSSTAQIEDNPTIQATAIPVSVDFGASALLRNNVVTATETDDAALDMDWGATVRLAGGNILNASPIGFSIFLQQGSTLNQRSQLDRVNGPVFLRSASNAEFRKVRITGNVQIEDHSLVRFRELSNDGNVAVTGNLSVSRDSGLNFVGGLPVRVVGNISCADQESSLGTDDLVLTGSKKGCTGYNNQNVQN